MLAKKVTALLVSAALVLALLAGCGGGRNQSLSQMLLNLLDGQYQNVSVEIDSDLEAKLRQAISESETDEELRAALEQLLGGGISFQRLGSGQQGDTAWTLIIYPGTDPDAAARSVYLDLDKVFAALPADGQYSSGFAMVETENGYAILVKATVDKAGTEDKPDPVTLESIAVTTQPKTTYWVGESFNPANMVITATYSNNTTKTLKDIKENGNQGVSWTPDGALSTTDTTITITYTENGKGSASADVSITVQAKPVTLQSITVTGPDKIAYEIDETFDRTGLVVTAYYSNGSSTIINNYTITDKDGQTVGSSYTFTTAGSYTLTVTYTEGAITKTGTIIITVSEDKGYTVSEDGKTYYVSNENGLLAWNEAAQSDYTLNCTLTENINLTGQEWTPVGNSGQTYNGTFDGQGHTITGLNISSPSEAVALFHVIGGGGKVMNLQLKDVTYNGSTAMGGIAHGNNGTITACSVMGTLTNTTNNGAVGGIAAINYGTITACWFNGTITGGSNVGGIAVFNLNAGSYDGKITACYWSGDGISNGVWGGYDITGTTKVDNSTVTWQTAVGGMNAALTGNDYQWKLGTDGLPVLQSNQ
ncbi:hypothetical protein B5G28_09020 [Faecalibacterium sp. An77]|uniref:bacterial Ig-like domain-containing protein n=1 Tax=Faecalibacterium sp. An77 TaxID=1965655 RepID=UPI000B3A3842|nr:bacterial Ig-like domain-containing protein [Faecalibacterium sp. An77]OUN38551.1 hypothetical protein B5G28_09020 [Faecalibacterium sp. An77]